ncbi:MAG: hypothetical protein SCL54_15490 [Bacillota bacterium]|nr:hypothetical protein [Bacillota bacterium]
MVFVKALRSTATHRETTHIFNRINNLLEDISSSETLKSKWIKYTKDYRYAGEITYENIIDSLRGLIGDL